MEAGHTIPNCSTGRGKKGKEPVKPDDSPDDSEGSEGSEHSEDSTPILRTALDSKYAMPKIVLGAVELCTYFPHHSRWTRYLLRLFRNSWKYGDIAKAQLHARGELTRANLRTRDAALRQQATTGGNFYYGVQNWTKRNWITTNHPDSRAVTANSSFSDLYDIGRDGAIWASSSAQNAWMPASGGVLAEPPTFLQMSQGVVNHPSGEDAGLLTQIIAWATSPDRGMFYASNNGLNDIPGIMASNPGRFRLPHEARNTPTWDQSALQRLNANVADP